MVDSLTKSERDGRAFWAVCWILALGTLAAYWTTGRFDFNNFDDQAFVSENRIVQAGLNWKGILWAFTTSYADYWHPLAWLSHMLDCQLFGLDPGAHHLVNVLFHIVNSLLLFYVFRRMTGALWPSAAVACLFAWHPLRVESVAWIAERKDVLSAFFWMLTFWAYARYADRRRLGRYLMVLAFLSLALMAKAMAVTLPFVLLLLDYWPLGRFRFSPCTFHRGTSSQEESRADPRSHRLSWGRLFAEKVPLLMLSLAACLMILLAQRHAEAARWIGAFPFPDRLANAVVSYARYLGKTVLPEDLNILYLHPGRWAGWQVAGSGLLLLLLSGGLLLTARKFPYLITGWLWFLGTLVPVLGFVQVGPQAMADRFSYIPSIGLFIMVAWGLAEIARRRPKWKQALATATGLVLAGCWLGTVLQVRTWRNSETIWRHALQADPANAYAHNNLGDALFRNGRTEEALAHFYQAIRLKPEMYSSHNNIGLALCLAGNIQEGTNHYVTALHYKPDYDAARFNFGFALASLGKLDDAIPQYEAALRASPQHSLAHTWLGNALLAKGQTNEAMVHLAEAIRTSPDYAEGHYYLGLALAQLGRTDAARQHFEKAVGLRPDLAEAEEQLGLSCALQGETEEALSHYRAAIRSHPQAATALNRLAWLLATHSDRRFRNGREAVQCARQACELSEFQNPAFLETLAAAYAEAGEFDKATATAQRAWDVAVTTGRTNPAPTHPEFLRLFQTRQPYRESP